LQRATRVIHALAKEAERRGWTVEPGDDLRIAAEDRRFSLRLREKGVRARGSWEEMVSRYRGLPRDSIFYRDRELPSGPYDAGATGQLELNGDWEFHGRQSRWGDRKSWTLDDRLPHLFREIEERIVEAAFETADRRIAAEKAAEAAKREAEERERQWHVLMDEARERLVEEQRATHLRKQADAWQEVERLRRYCDAVQAAYADRSDTAEWLAWARAYAARLDPLSEPPTMPAPIEATPEVLQPYLPVGWSAEGPEAPGYRTRHLWS
jgi:hypothetical protein